jgi:hypothetical protein
LIGCVDRPSVEFVLDRNEILRDCDRPNLLPRLFESIGMLDKGARDLSDGFEKTILLASNESHRS